MVPVAIARLSGICTAAILALTAAAPGGAQASAYVPLDDVSYAYVDALVARGQLRSLSGLERPYTRGELAAAIDSSRMQVAGVVPRGWLEALSRSISKYQVRANEDSMGGAHARIGIDLFATAQTSSRRELMLADSRSNVRPGGSIRILMAGGPVAVSIRPQIDNRLNVDPEFPGRKDRTIGGRVEDGYASAQWKYGEIAVGRVARNWGPPMLHGMQLGNYAYTYDHLYGKVGTRAFHISSVLARLDDDSLPGGQHIARYFSIHRLALSHASWEIGATESFIYSGVGRGFEPSLSNPFNVFGLSWRNERADGNLAMGVDGTWRSRRFGILSTQILLDDLQIDRCDTICGEPSSYGLTLSAEGVPLHGDHRAFASYTRVSNLAYRTPNQSERYAVLNVGLGRGFSDYDETRIGADLALLARAPLRVYAAYRRQGEGDYRAAFPPKAAYASTPAIFSGAVMKVARLGVTGAAGHRSFEGSADLGVNRSTNDGHVIGRTRTSFEGRVKITWIPSFRLDF